MKNCNQIIIATEKTHPLVGTIHSIPLSNHCRYVSREYIASLYLNVSLLQILQDRM